MATLHWNMTIALSILKATDLAASLDMRVQSDQSALDGASVDLVRDTFKAWVDSAKAKEETKHAPLDWGGAMYPRYTYCVHADVDAVDSVVRRAPQPPRFDREKVGYVNLVKLDMREITDCGEDEEVDGEDDGRDENLVRAPVYGLFGPETYGDLHHIEAFYGMRRG